MHRSLIAYLSQVLFESEFLDLAYLAFVEQFKVVEERLDLLKSRVWVLSCISQGSSIIFLVVHSDFWNKLAQFVQGFLFLRNCVKNYQ